MALSEETRKFLNDTLKYCRDNNINEDEVFNIFMRREMNQMYADYIKSVTCNFCRKKLKNVKQCIKHEDKCKTKPKHTIKDFLRLVDNDESKLSSLQRQGLSLCIITRTRIDDYEFNEYLRPDNTIEINIDPYGLRTNPIWIARNEEHIKKYKKALPMFLAST